MTDIVDTRENAGCVLPAGQLLHRTCGPAQSLHFAFRLDKGTVIPQKTHPCNPIPLPRTLGSSNFYRSIPRGILAGAAYLIYWADIFVLCLGMIFMCKACQILLFIRCSSNIHFLPSLSVAIQSPLPASPIRCHPSALGPPACQGPFAAVHYSRPVQCAAPGGRLPVLRAAHSLRSAKCRTAGFYGTTGIHRAI